MMTVKGKDGLINIIQVYAPTSDKSDEEIESFYQDIRTLLNATKKHQVTIVLGDFNAKVGDTKVDGCTGAFGLGKEMNVEID